MDELLEQFLIEAPEQIDQAAADLLALETNPDDKATLDSAFRAIHTLKGSVALFDFSPMGDLLHAAESALDDIRKKKRQFNKQTATPLLAGVAACEKWLRVIAQTESLPAGAATEAARLKGDIEFCDRVQSTAADDYGAELRAFAETKRDLLNSLEAATVIAVRYQPPQEVFFSGHDPIATLKTVPDLVALEVSLDDAPSDADPDPYLSHLVFHFLSTASEEAVREAFPAEHAISVTDVSLDELVPSTLLQTTSGSDPGIRVLRVDASRVERLADMVGELIVAKNELGYLVARAGAESPELARALRANQNNLNRLSAELHSGVMTLRRVPLSRTLRRFPRLVRDLADKLGKQVTLDIAGDVIEGDKVVVDGLYDPLLHVLRNAIDHGLENSVDRERSGKPRDGRVAITVSTAGENLIIAVSDDGAGIDAGKIRARALKSGLRSAVDLEKMSDADLLELIFEPGLTTSNSLSEVSGRGVGMDAVRTAVQALSGRTEISSTPGMGTTVRIVVPQTVTVTTVLVVEVGNEKFGLPIDAAVETARIDRSRVSHIRAGEAFIMRNRTIPLLRLGEILGVEGDPPGGAYTAIIAQVGTEFVGLAVDRIVERIEVIVRPLTGLLAGIPGAIGTSLLGDGSVLVVLDIPDLVNGH